MTIANRIQDKLPIISVIVPVYNVEEYLTRCVKSICAQTYQNIEIILVEDGSPDGCGALCDELAEQDDRIKVIHQSNQGVSAARNRGIDESTGEYIAFVDGDDYIDSDMYKMMYERLQESGADIVCCGFVREYEGNAEKEVMYPDKIYDRIEAMNELIINNMAGGCSPCNKLMKKALWQNIRFPTGVFWEDMRILYKIYMRADRIACMSDICYHYEQRENSTIHTYHGVDDDYRIQAEYERAVNIEGEYTELSKIAYDGIANECMHNCMKIWSKYKTKTEVYARTFERGYQSYQKIRKTFPMSQKRKMMYLLFYQFTGIVLFCARIGLIRK